MRWCGLDMTIAVVSSRLPVTRSKGIFIHRAGEVMRDYHQRAAAWRGRGDGQARTADSWTAGMLQFGPTLLRKRR